MWFWIKTKGQNGACLVTPREGTVSLPAGSRPEAQGQAGRKTELVSVGLLARVGLIA